MNINTIKDIVIVALILFCINKFAPVDGVILGFSGLGFIVFILGFLKIYKKSQFEVRDDKKFKKNNAIGTCGMCFSDILGSDVYVETFIPF